MRLGPFLVIALAAATACGSFGDAQPSADDAGANDAAAGGDAATEAQGPSVVGCASLAPFLFCADFDEATSIEAQTTKPGDKPLETATAGNFALKLEPMNPYSAPNAVNVTGNGASAFRIALGRSDIALTTTHVRLKMRIRANALPTSGDAYVATLDFSNYRVSAVLHASGTIGLAQSSPPDEQPEKQETANGNVMKLGTWSRLEIDLDPGKSQVAAKLDALGSYATIRANPTGPVTVGVGIGYCDVPCGKPSLDFDDVVLTEE